MQRTGARRGNYHLIMTMLLSMGVGFAALSIDLSWIRLAQSGSQAVADAAASAALIELRRTGSKTLATQAAEEFVARNAVGGQSPELIELQFGRWDEDSKTFTLDNVSPHAVRAVVGRPGDNPLELFFAPGIGLPSLAVERESIAATRSMQIVLVMDITGSFASDIHHARIAAENFLELLKKTHGEYDQIGMTLFYHRYGVEYTPMTYLDDEVIDDTIEGEWAQINIASQPIWNYFNTGGKYPEMPRNYWDEGGTDHHTGIEMAITMFEENADPFAFRAMVVLTDGYPSNLSANFDRAADGFTETRWREYQGPVPHYRAEIRAATLASTQRAWDEQGVNVWSVSYGAQETFLMDMCKGVGKFYYTNEPSLLESIFSEIASSLPVATVR